MPRLDVYRYLRATLVAIAAAAALPPADAATTAIILRDQVALRAAPRESAQQQAVLWQGEAVEIRGERLDYVQVYDYKRERGGFVHASLVRRLTTSADEVPELLTILRFLRDQPGSEALAIGVSAAFIQAAPASVLQNEAGIEALDVLGTVAERLARRASGNGVVSRAVETTLSAHLDVAARYGVNFASFEREGRMQLCYDGAAFQRVLAMKAKPEQHARAALALTRADCINPDLRPFERAKLDTWRAEVLEKVDAAALPGYIKNRVLMRRAQVLSALAYQRARRGEAADALAQRAIGDFAGVNKLELPDGDLSLYNDTAMRVSASRWAAVPATPVDAANGLAIATETRQPGETCVHLIDATHDNKNSLVTRCTYAQVWAASATPNREGTALALAVQPFDAWRELWVFRKEGNAWQVSVLPPAASNPEIGYVEFAGWAPGGKQLLIAREARGEGKYKRSFETVRLDTLNTERQAADPTHLTAFQRWQDAGWKRATLSVR